MAKLKPLSATVNPDMAELNNSGTKELSVMMPVSQIKLRPVFQELFPINDKDLQSITADIKEHGYDPSQPVHIWQEQNVLIDGHTRFAATKNAGLYDIPVYKHSFTSEQDALAYALRAQLNRRNLDDAGLFTAVAKMDSLKKTGRPTADSDADSKGKSSEQLAGMLGTSARKVEKARSVMKNADEETKKAVQSGDLSLNKAYNKVHSKPDGEETGHEPDSGSIDDSENMDGIEDFTIEESDPLSMDNLKFKSEDELPGSATMFEKLLTATLSDLAEMLHDMQTKSSSIHSDENPDILTVEEWKEVLRTDHE
jgi:ParB family chromosome partitioning protein